jgi:hexosaminidase
VERQLLASCIIVLSSLFVWQRVAYKNYRRAKRCLNLATINFVACCELYSEHCAATQAYLVHIPTALLNPSKFQETNSLPDRATGLSTYSLGYSVVFWVIHIRLRKYIVPSLPSHYISFLPTTSPTSLSLHRLLYLIMRSSAFLFSSLISSALALWPQPISYTHGSDALWLTEDVKITYNGGSVWWHSLFVYDDEYTKTVFDEQIMGFSYGGRSASAATSKSIVTDAIKRAKQNLFKEGLVPWKLVPRNELSSFEPSLNASKKYITSLAITQTGTENSTAFKPADGQVDESYNLTITADGQAFITSPSAYGVLHGLSSFVQLFYKHSAKGAGIYTNLAPVEICDAPKFAHRGLNMDVARNWYPVESIERTIDALAFNKFNRLHLHVTDAQSWPLEIPAIPELADKGAYSSGLSYSPSDVRYLQEYAQARGVEVIIEIDMPGHTTSIGLAFPELMTAYNAAPWDTYCAEPPCGSLQLNNPKVGDFLDTLFADLLPRVSPYSSYFHTGGDELNVNAYSLDPTVNSNDTAVIQPLLQKFVDRNHDQIRAAGLTPVVWEEMYTTWNLTLGSDVIVQTWLSDASVAQVVNAGHKAIAGNYNFWVSFSFDCMKQTC